MAKKTISWPLALRLRAAAPRSAIALRDGAVDRARPAPVSKDHFTLKSEYDLFIGGKWVKPKSGNYFDTINPANEQKVAAAKHIGDKRSTSGYRSGGISSRRA
jgi:hypothetical protein